MSQLVRPRFTPSPALPNGPWEPLQFTARTQEWTPVCSCPANFPVESFDAAISQLVNHPEYNSTLILRSEIIEESSTTAEHEVPSLGGFRFVRKTRRRLIPRRPGRDLPVEQNCTLYAAINDVSIHDVNGFGKENEERDNTEVPATCLVLTPKPAEGMPLPYFHPPVLHIAFRYLQPPIPLNRDTGSAHDGNREARLLIEVVLSPDAPEPTDVNSRLYRTCLSLLETLHRYGWGLSTNYRKQVQHDCIIPREEYQDLYLVMRERYKYLVGEWHENTDPLKHVFEDIGIATYLMLLWKQDTSDMTSHSCDEPNYEDSTETQNADRMPWHDWPRPRGGFLDFGCGNGLLVHILISEGYVGEGVDLRARNSWRHYPAETQAHLHVHAINPLDLPIPQSGSAPAILNPHLKPGTFIIANHADELSPWTPVLATLSGASGFLSIPCCPWSFDTRFERAQMPLGGSEKPSRGVAFVSQAPDGTDIDTFVNSLHLGGMGGDARKSTYAAYRVWLACLGVQCGWTAESDTLRIPSTRNWALVGRKRCGEESRYMENALTIIKQARERGLFKTRRPEGKAGDH